MLQRFGGIQRNKEKEGIEKGKKYQERSRKIKWLRFTNELVPFLKGLI